MLDRSTNLSSGLKVTDSQSGFRAFTADTVKGSSLGKTDLPSRAADRCGAQGEGSGDQGALRCGLLDRASHEPRELKIECINSNNILEYLITYVLQFRHL